MMRVTGYGKELKKFRIEKGLKLKDMARDLQMTASYLSNIEAGHNSIPLWFSGKLKSTYDLDDVFYSVLLQLEQEEGSASCGWMRINLERFSGDEKTLFLAFIEGLEKLSDQGRDEIMRILKKEGSSNAN